MSYIKIAQFLSALGLIFIQPLNGFDPSKPVHLFAEKLEGAPDGEFYDILKVGGTVYLAGSGLIRVRDGDWEAVFEDGRYTALCADPQGRGVWYAGQGGIGLISSETGIPQPLHKLDGYVWELVVFRNDIWYFSSKGYGRIDTENLNLEDSWEADFARVMVFQFLKQDYEETFIADSKGLFRLTDLGIEIVLGEEFSESNVISWMSYHGDHFLLGTLTGVYSWLGNARHIPERIPSNYEKYFKKGISNAVSAGANVAIVDYPSGIAIWNNKYRRMIGYASSDSGLKIGDVFKVCKAGKDSVFVLGTEGVGLLNLKEAHRFIPVNPAWGVDNYRGHGIVGHSVNFLFGKKWIHLNHEGFTEGELMGNPYWVTRDFEGRLVAGEIDSYYLFNKGAWEQRFLDYPVLDVQWGEETGYAIGQDGLYSLDQNLNLKLIYPSDDHLYFVGLLYDSIYFSNTSGDVIQLTSTGQSWLERRVVENLPEELRYRVSSGNFILAATEAGLWRLTSGGLERLSLDADWRVRGLGQAGETAWVAFYNPLTRETAVGRYGEGSPVMLSVPHLDKVGELRDLVVTGEHLGLVGEYGIGWYALAALPEVPQPQVTFNLLFEDREIQDRTIPSGMHFIDLDLDFLNPEIPSRIQFRINRQRWRDVNLNDPTLQFAGHGSFTVELQAVHPNGVVSESRVIQFGIAPPWYLNPLYQGILVVLLMFAIWGVYILRHAQLKRTNLWLQSEVRKQTRELETATAARTNFLAGLSHDIRNPLNGVLMIAETLSRNPPKSSEDARLKDLREFGIIVDRMLGEILDFSAIDQATVPTAFIPVSIADILKSALQQNQFSIQKEMVNATLTLAPELEKVVIRTDRNWMIKVLTNLIVNALEYSGTERIEVGARSHYMTQTEVDLEIFVNDWGQGIDDSEKEFVFDRFYRGESGIESGKHGTGLGLSICQEIAHAIGGHLLLEDNEPSGCRFILKGRFTRVEGATELDQEAVLAGLHGRRVLVVDDLEYNRRSIVDFLTTIGCQCDQCGNGREALTLLAANRYHLALLDWDLPGMMGPDIARQHRQKHADDPVLLVALTAYTDGEKKRTSEQSGMNGYISKPLTASRLAYCLANISGEQPEREAIPDRVDHSELAQEIDRHIEDCLLYGDQYEWENLRRSAHRLTTLALMQDNQRMQQVCRDLQIAAQSENLDDVLVGLAELRQWKRV